ncbi:hypothetical protein TWF481_007664 [Arthrobotrys musiformis]|uniref:Uncharacterized protein n=1 Tax=Arthrobotrys musiformis TaxID=47236 RepID=A0AAV9WHW2_9PEZI
MWSKSFSVSVLVLSGVLGQVALAGPIPRAGEDVLFKRAPGVGDVARAHGPTGGSIIFSLARAASECQHIKPKEAPNPVQQQQAPQESENLSLGDRFLQIPSLLWNGVQQIPKIWSEENRDAFLKSAGDLVTAFNELPAAMQSGFNDLTNTENLEAFQKSFGDLKQAVASIPEDAKAGVQDLTSVQNWDAFEKSFVALGTALSEIPDAVGSGIDDLKQAPGDIANAFAAAPRQLTVALQDFMRQYNTFAPLGSNQREIIDGLIGSIPVNPRVVGTFATRVGMSLDGIAGVAQRACSNDKESLSLVQ